MHPRTLALSMVAGWTALASGGAARAATITVTSLADNTVIDGQVTLREAILAANTDTSVDGSAPGSGADQIVFATGPGVIALNGTQLPVVTQALAIVGPGPNQLALDGGHASRVLEVATATELGISALTIRNGRVLGGDGGGILGTGTAILFVLKTVFSGNAVTGEGGAIRTTGPLSVSSSTFSGNSALNGGAVAARGALSAQGNRFEGNFTGGIAPFAGGGGALLTTGSAFVDNSLFSSNRAGNGGAIVNQGTLSLTGSTLNANTAINSGGAIVSIVGVEMRVSFCTLTLNRADENTDGTGDGGGISVGAAVPLTLRGTIVAQNTHALLGPQDVSGAVQAGSSFNLIGVDTGLTGISHGVNGNQIGTAASPLDPLLGPLQDNGGHPTRALLPGSPAIDGDSGAFCATTDQRGVGRPQDGDLDGTAHCDIGAYEAFAVSTTAVRFYTTTPCRAVDTRGAEGPTGGPALGANESRFFPIAGLCGVPGDARAVALNVTVVNQTDMGNLRLYPAGAAAPDASTINFVPDMTRANNAVLAMGVGGTVAVRCDMPAGSTGTLNLVIDVFGYFK
jgi:CSLREA domain-containing protein